ncbi:dTDP-4-dehydrorhamnose 3,5-epimerase [Shewanella psychrophila]|uniref:dTDP-4-dehydrorhamnose 3,5-epimerase n=1 Tax=Shewanella psychrophila TaxID=225848 RepID=A0A1S6HIN2_9GAMM|nr:dTDP-4-dehydrorhamnose 3,5-epimerase [Shewanella psychrophila]AQS35369.1 dTDP-4-dehydrorhamnose 3,5-epimerase [Shewanella psychrophila]
MIITDTPIADLKLLSPRVHEDERGYFCETFRDAWFKQQIADVTFVQENHSRSIKGCLRGLHFQSPRSQGKLIRVIVGEIFDVAVDLRENSPTLGQWFGTYLSAKNRHQMWIPAGFAHGFYVTSSAAEIIYKCTAYYAPEFEKILAWNDETLAIDWPLEGQLPKLSNKDNQGLSFNAMTKGR